MANGDITLTIGISGTLSGGDTVATFSESKTVSSIADYYDRVINVGTAEATILNYAATVTGNTLSTLNVIVIYNMDSTNFLTVGVADTGAKSVYFKIPAGKFFVLTSDQMECDDDTGAAFAAFNTADIVTLKADTAAVRARVVAY